MKNRAVNGRGEEQGRGGRNKDVICVRGTVRFKRRLGGDGKRGRANRDTVAKRQRREGNVTYDLSHPFITVSLN